MLDDNSSPDLFWFKESIKWACATDDAVRATQLKVPITRWLHLHQKEGLCQEENITTRICIGEMSCN
jgi:hypothetical protein